MALTEFRTRNVRALLTATILCVALVAGDAPATAQQSADPRSDVERRIAQAQEALDDIGVQQVDQEDPDPVELELIAAETDVRAALVHAQAALVASRGRNVDVDQVESELTEAASRLESAAQRLVAAENALGEVEVSADGSDAEDPVVVAARGRRSARKILRRLAIIRLIVGVIASIVTTVLIVSAAPVLALIVLAAAVVVHTRTRRMQDKVRAECQRTPTSDFCTA